MEKYVTFEQAKWLKEKGMYLDGYLQDVWLGNKYEKKRGKIVEEPVFGLGSSSKLPEQHQVVDWLLEKYGIWIYVTRDGGWWIPVIQDLSNEKEEGAVNIDMNNVDVCFNSPTEAYEAAIDYIKDNNLI